MAVFAHAFLAAFLICRDREIFVLVGKLASHRFLLICFLDASVRVASRASSAWSLGGALARASGGRWNWCLVLLLDFVSTRCVASEAVIFLPLALVAGLIAFLAAFSDGFLACGPRGSP